MIRRKFSGYSQSNNFNLTSLDDVNCSNDTSIKKRRNSALFNTVYGKGTGNYNGQKAKVEFTFVDGGRYGRKDLSEITITDYKGNIILQESGSIKRGNNTAEDCYDCYDQGYDYYDQNSYYTTAIMIMDTMAIKTGN